MDKSGPAGKEAGHAHSHGAAGHNHAHGHAHGPPRNFGTAFAVGTVLNVGIVALQVTYGLIAHSTALLADAGHNLSDVLSLIVAWAAMGLARRRAAPRYTYGLRGSTILAALFNALFLLVVMGGIAWEAIQRFSEPAPIAGGIVMAVAGAAIVVNGLTAWLFASGSKTDINIRGAFLHMLADALVSVGVVGAGAIVYFTGWLWVDPAVTLVIVVVVVYGTWDLLRESIRMALAAVPSNIELDRVRGFLSDLPGVSRVHDLHVWPISTTATALTCHLVMPDGHPGDAFVLKVADTLHEKFDVEHTTIQVEVEEDADCRLRDGHTL